MDNEYWLERWKTKKTEFDQAQPNPFLIQYFQKLKLKAGANVLVPLCGKSIDMLWLAQQGYRVTGIELHLEACREFFIQHQIPFVEKHKESFHVLTGDNITLFAGDYFALNKKWLDPIKAIYDRAALVALPEEMRTRYVEHLNTLTDSETQILLITSRYDQNEMPGPPFSVDEAEVKRLYVNYNIACLHNEAAEMIPPHLKAKGLKKAHNLIFHIRTK